MRTIGILTLWLMAASAFAQVSPPSELMDVVIIIDRSRSMLYTDPKGLVAPQATHLVDQLELSNRHNRVALIWFSNEVISATELTSDFDAIRQKLQNLSRPVGATMLHKPLEKARQLLEGSDRQKRIVLIADGQADDVELVRQQLPLLREKQIPIHAIGFSSQIRRQFLDQLAQNTGGKANVVATADELEDAVNQTVPRPWNVLSLFAGEHPGGEQDFSTTVSIPTHITKARFRISFNPSPRADSVEIQFIAPSGQVISNRDRGLAESVSFTSGRDQQSLVFERLFTSEPGEWTVRVTSQAGGLPGFKVFVDGKTNLKLIVETEPNLAAHPYTDPMKIRVTLQSPTSERPILPDQVRVKVINSTNVVQNLRWANDHAIYQPETQRADAQTIVATALYRGAEIRARLAIRLVAPNPVTFAGTPSKLILPTVGVSNREADAEAIAHLQITVQGQFRGRVSFAVDSMNLYHKRNGSALSSTWFRVGTIDDEMTMPVDRFKGRVGIEGVVLRFEVNLPPEIPGDIEDGLYEGEMIITSERALEPLEVDVELTLHKPELVASKSVLYKMPWFLQNEMSGTLTVSTTASSAQNVTVVLPKYVGNAQAGNVATLRVADDSLEITLEDAVSQHLRVSVAPETKVKIPIQLQPLFVEAASIKAGRYKQEITVSGCGREARIPVELRIPTHYRANVLQGGLKILAILFGLIGGVNASRNFWRRKRFGARKKITIRLTDGKMIGIGQGKGDGIRILEERLRDGQVVVRRDGDCVIAELGPDAEVRGERETEFEIIEGDTISLYSTANPNEKVIDLMVTRLPIVKDELRLKVTTSPFTEKSALMLLRWAAVVAAIVLLITPLLFSQLVIGMMNHF